jgi:hypothetical protein
LGIFRFSCVNKTKYSIFWEKISILKFKGGEKIPGLMMPLISPILVSTIAVKESRKCRMGVGCGHGWMDGSSSSSSSSSITVFFQQIL